VGIVRQHRSWDGSRRPAEIAPGELVWARIINGLENPKATGKTRPVILIEASGSAWRTMGLTTNSRYRDSSPRVAIPDAAIVGLRLPGWLWGGRLCWLAGIDIENHIGWVDGALALEVARLAALDEPTTSTLLSAAAEHHCATALRDIHAVKRGMP
jgi:hypothetical protein